MSHSCNDYIIKDGGFVRDFETMYKEIDDPWDQRTEHGTDPLNQKGLELLKEYFTASQKKVDQVLDLGCAEGYYAKELLEISGGVQYLGVDVSQTVIEKAKQMNGQENVQFAVSDIREFDPALSDRFDLIFSAKTIYYVGPEIDTALENIDAYLKPGGIFCYTYNQTEDSFSNQWITNASLRDKLQRRYFEKYYTDIGTNGKELFVVGIFHKTQKP